MSETMQEAEGCDRRVPGSVRPGRWARVRGAWRRAGDEGMVAAEYAIVTLVGCLFAGVLLTVLSSAQVRTTLSNLIKRALSVA